jgi:hypothetical protein
MKLSSIWQPFDIYVQLETHQTRWQYSADQQEWASVAQIVKLNVTAKGEHYFLYGLKSTVIAYMFK